MKVWVVTVSNASSGHGRPVASPVTISTLVPANFSRSASAATGSISMAVSAATRCRSQSVAAPGPGPISSMR